LGYRSLPFPDSAGPSWGVGRKTTTYARCRICRTFKQAGSATFLRGTSMTPCVPRSSRSSLPQSSRACSRRAPSPCASSVSARITPARRRLVRRASAEPCALARAMTRYRGTTSPFPNFALDLCFRKIPPERHLSPARVDSRVSNPMPHVAVPTPPARDRRSESPERVRVAKRKKKKKHRELHPKPTAARQASRGRTDPLDGTRSAGRARRRSPARDSRVKERSP